MAGMASVHIIRRLAGQARSFRELILYGMIGGFSAALDFGVYTLLVSCLAVHYIAANSLSVLAGIVTSFTLNRNYNFRVRDRTPVRFASFLTVGLVGMAVSNAVLWLLVTRLALDALLSKLLAVVVVAAMQFVANKYVTFRKLDSN